jgi:DNA-binding transcriptional regulator YdaS (Cro superfamily)
MADLIDLYASARKAIERAGGQSEWARRIGVTPQQLSDFLSARRAPIPKILAALGYQRRVSVTYVRSNH